MKLEDAKILIGDDSILARKQLRDTIASLGECSFIEASDGQQAVELYKQEKPDLVFLDIVMPVKDGIGAVRDIIAENPSAIIIMVSSIGTQTMLKEAIQSGARDFIQKPLDVEQLKSVIASYFEGR